MRTVATGTGAGIGVATGMFLAGIGSDTAGSIRVPAAFCGVTGLMPGYGRVPRTGCVPLGYSLDRIGPLARSARDSAAVLEVLAGPDPADPDSAARPMPRPEFRGDLTGLRVGVVRDRHFPPGRDPALDGVFAEALAVLAGLGARLSSITLPYQTELVTAVLVTVASEALAHHRADLCHRWLDFGRGTRGLLATGALVTGADYVQAQRVRQVAQRAVGALFTEVDLVVCPTASVGAPPFASLLSPAGLPE
ncbi:amidase, partial [Amycolatopsis sp. WAC 04169]|uniref:amidase n=1 Tax=Amycolatopsis sp. WAC 04169 TaxID=2203197 RepID=UPI0021064AC6